MASNAPGSTASSAGKQFLGLPLWAWGLGLGAFVIAVFVIFRGQSQSSSNSGQTVGGPSSTTGYGVPVPYPVPTSAANNAPTNSQSFGNVIATAREGYHNNLVAIWAAPTTASAQITQVPSGTELPVAAPVMQGGSFTYGDVTSSSWQPVSYGGKTGYIWQPDAPTILPSQSSLGQVFNTQAPAGIYG